MRGTCTVIPRLSPITCLQCGRSTVTSVSVLNNTSPFSPDDTIVTV